MKRVSRRPAALVVASLLASGLVAVGVASDATAAPVGVPYGGSGGSVQFLGTALNQEEDDVPPGLNDATTVVAHGHQGYAVRADGGIAAWGVDSDYGEMRGAALQTDVVALASGLDHMVALRSDGTVTAWGSSQYRATRVPTGLNDVVAVAAGYSFGLALKSDGTVVSWGNYGGSTGRDPVPGADVPTGLSQVVAIAAAGQHSLALKSDGTVVAWGTDRSGEGAVPAGLTDVVQISASYGNNVALKRDGTVVAWGSSFAPANEPPAGLSGVTAVAAGGSTNLALKSDGTVVAWGDNRFGIVDQAAQLSGVTAITAGGYYGFVVTPVQFSAAAAPSTTYRSSYSYGFAARYRGQPVSNYAVASGSLPPGLSLNPTSGVLSGTPSAAGTYEFSVRATSADGVWEDTPEQTLTVDPVRVTVTADSVEKVYGDPDPAFTYKASGLLPGDALTTLPSCGVTGGHAAADTYAVTCSGASAGPNYTVTYASGTLTVAARPVTVRADSQSVVYGDPDPQFTYTVDGLVGREDLASRPGCGVVGAHTRVGTYPIICSGATASSSYTVGYEPGTLTVAAKPGVVTADPQTITYGEADPAFTYQVSGLKDEDRLDTAPTCTVNGPHSSAGTYPIVCSGGSDADYDLSYKAGTLTVLKKTVTVTANNASKVYGAADPAFTYTASGFVGQQTFTTKPTCTVPATHTNVGGYAIVCSGAVTSANHLVTYTPATLSITKAPTTLTAAGILIPSLLRPTAALTRPDTGAAISGQTVSFASGAKTVCVATTNAKGVAQCSSTLLITLKLTATYAATTNYTGSTDTAGLF